MGPLCTRALIALPEPGPVGDGHVGGDERLEGLARMVQVPLQLPDGDPEGHDQHPASGRPQELTVVLDDVLPGLFEGHCHHISSIRYSLSSCRAMMVPSLVVPTSVKVRTFSFDFFGEELAGVSSSSFDSPYCHTLPRTSVAMGSLLRFRMSAMALWMTLASKPVSCIRVFSDTGWPCSRSNTARIFGVRETRCRGFWLVCRFGAALRMGSFDMVS